MVLEGFAVKRNRLPPPPFMIGAVGVGLPILCLGLLPVWLGQLLPALPESHGFACESKHGQPSDDDSLQQTSFPGKSLLDLAIIFALCFPTPPRCSLPHGHLVLCCTPRSA